MTQIIDEIECYDPELALHNEDFESLCYPAYQKYIPGNFWYISRSELISFLIKSYKNNRNQYCEIGCGNGFVLKKIAADFPDLSIEGTDIYIEGIKYSKKNNSDNVHLFQYNLFLENLEKKFELIGCYDVLEHIEQDRIAIKNIRNLLTNDGLAFITVPSEMSIWSNNDVINKHKRRYSKTELKEKFEAAGFRVLYLNYFMFFLFPLLWIKCKLSNPITSFDAKHLSTENNTEQIAEFLNLKINPVLNFAFKLILKFEVILIKIGFKFPIGSSLICVVQKK